MAIVTLTTDYGDTTYYVARLKGSLLTANPNAQIIDIAHNITPYSTMEAAFTLRHTFRSFPKNTIHVVDVGAYVISPHRFLLVEYAGHIFCVPDNGIFPLVFGKGDCNVYAMPIFFENTSNPIHDGAIAGLTRLLNGEPPMAIGEETFDIVQWNNLTPTTTENTLRGSIIHIDSYGNAITNITRKQFEKSRNNRNFDMFLKGSGVINRLSEHYNSVVSGEKLCLFNSMGLFEIAMYGANASQMLGLKIYDYVQIEFKHDPTRKVVLAD